MARGEEMPQNSRLTCGHFDMLTSNIIFHNPPFYLRVASKTCMAHNESKSRLANRKSRYASGNMGHSHE